MANYLYSPKTRKKSNVEIRHTLKVIINAGEASSAPPLGPLLGQYQINIVEFCKEFNVQTSTYEPGVPLLTKIKKKKFTGYLIQFSQPSINELMKQAMADVNALQNSAESEDDLIPDTTVYEKIDYATLYDIIQLKLPQLNTTLFGATSTIFGFLLSSKIKLVKDISFKETKKFSEEEE